MSRRREAVAESEAPEFDPHVSELPDDAPHTIDPDAPQAPTRKRRTKAEMEAARGVQTDPVAQLKAARDALRKEEEMLTARLAEVRAALEGA